MAHGRDVAWKSQTVSSVSEMLSGRVVEKLEPDGATEQRLFVEAGTDKRWILRTAVGTAELPEAGQKCTVTGWSTGSGSDLRFRVENVLIS